MDMPKRTWKAYRDWFKQMSAERGANPESIYASIQRVFPPPASPRDACQTDYDAGPLPDASKWQVPIGSEPPPPNSGGYAYYCLFWMYEQCLHWPQDIGHIIHLVDIGRHKRAAGQLSAFDTSLRNLRWYWYYAAPFVCQWAARTGGAWSHGPLMPVTDLSRAYAATEPTAPVPDQHIDTYRRFWRTLLEHADQADEAVVEGLTRATLLMDRETVAFAEALESVCRPPVDTPILEARRALQQLEVAGNRLMVATTQFLSPALQELDQHIPDPE